MSYDLGVQGSETGSPDTGFIDTAPPDTGDPPPDLGYDCDGYKASQDCVETSPYVYPGAPEIPHDDMDNDCDDTVDEMCGD